MTRHRQTLLLLALVACAERQADDDVSDEPEAEPTCMILPASGHWEDGSSRTIQNEWGTVGTVCMCLTEDERMADEVRQELNDLAHVECERISTLVWDFDWTECQELHESGAWLNGVFIARDETEWMNHEGLTCDDGELQNCAVRESDGDSPLALFVLLAALGLRTLSDRDPLSRGRS